MKKRLILSLLAAVLLLGTLAPAAYATALEERHIADGTCGEGLSWSLKYFLTYSNFTICYHFSKSIITTI